jgi:hypothetical protein
LDLGCLGNVRRQGGSVLNRPLAYANIANIGMNNAAHEEAHVARRFHVYTVSIGDAI